MYYNKLKMLLLLWIFLFTLSCSTKAPVLKVENLRYHNNDVVEINNPSWKINYPWYYGGLSSVSGAYLGYKTNFTNTGNIYSALTGAITGYSIWYLFTHIDFLGLKPNNYVYKLSNDNNEIEEWLAIFNNKTSRNYRMIHSNVLSAECYSLTLINTNTEEDNFKAEGIEDARYFIQAWINPKTENVKRISEEILWRSVYRNRLMLSKDIINISGFDLYASAIEDVCLEFCDSAKLCKEYADLYPHRFNDAEEKAYSWIEFSKNKNKIYSSNQEERARDFLLYFSNSSKKSFIITELKDYTYRGNQEKDYKSCKSIYDYDKFIYKYDLDNYDPNGYVKNAKEKLISDLKKELSNLANYVDVYERFITDYNSVKYSEARKVISEVKVKVFNMAFNSCSTWMDYEKFIKEYENKGYSKDNSKIAEAKVKVYTLMYQSCNTIQDFESFIERYSSCLDCQEVISAKEKVFELSYNNCRNFSDYENCYNKFKDLNYSNNKEKLNQARYNGYKLRYSAAFSSWDFNSFINLYSSYDPDKLINSARSMANQRAEEEEKQRIAAAEAARLAEIARQKEERERRCKSTRILFDYGGTFFCSPSGDESFSSDLISRNCTISKSKYGIYVNNNSYGYCDCIIGQYQINYSYIVTNLSGEPVKSISNSFILKIDGSADEYRILIDYDDGRVISVNGDMVW